MSPKVDRYEGKTVVENKDTDTGMTLYYVDPSVYANSSLWASKAENRGAAVHTFFYEGTQLLTDSAQEYVKLADNEILRYRDIDDGSFVRSTLDFFTGGNYRYSDVKAVESQMETIVMDLFRMVRGGEDADVSRLQNKLIIGGRRRFNRGADGVSGDG